jgi:hypothetical protein
VNAEGLDFVAQGFRVSFEGELACGIDAEERNGRQTGERADVDDVPALLTTHQRQNRIDHPGDAEEIGLELRPGLR